MPDGNRSVFVNCPFDSHYNPLFYAIVFTIIRSGFVARCALETDNAADNRFEKICKIIGECRFGVHDISRTETSGDPPLPRFNMPLELGLFLGARKYGGTRDRGKSCIIFDRVKYRYQRYISDISGQDIHSHNNDATTLIIALAAWLRTQSNDKTVPGGQIISEEFAAFNLELSAILSARQLSVDEMTFRDYCLIVSGYLDVSLTPSPARS